MPSKKTEDKIQKPVIVKPAAKPVAKGAAKTTAKTADLTVPVHSLTGTESTIFLSLPVEIFGGVVNNSLLNQAVRVYLNNKKSHHGNTKTRGEVEGSTRKIFKQKGTGRARHGSIRANIFVGGGIVFGPKPRKVSLDLPQKMKKAALISALSQKAKNGQVKAISGLDKASGKTKEMVQLFKALDVKSALFITSGNDQLAERAVKNLRGISLLSAEKINALEVISHQSLILTKEAVEKLESRIKNQEVAL